MSRAQAIGEVTDLAVTERHETADFLQRLVAHGPHASAQPWQAWADEQRAGSALEQALDDHYSSELARLQAELAAARSAREATESALRQLLVKVKGCLHDELLAEKDAREARETLLLQLLEQRSRLARQPAAAAETREDAARAADSWSRGGGVSCVGSE